MTDDEFIDCIDPFVPFKIDTPPIELVPLKVAPVQLRKAIEDPTTGGGNSNVVRLPCAGHMYIVRTQAGFRRACKEFSAAWGSDGLEPDGFPIKYPALISLSAEYHGYHFISVGQIHLNDLISSLSAIGEL
jgi:hypothetical protein